MQIINTKTNETFTLKRHKALPSFMETGIKRTIKFAGKENAFIMHPTKEDSVRVSLVVDGTRYYRDEQAFKDYVTGLKVNTEFEAAETKRGRKAGEPKAPKAQAAPKAEAKPAKGKAPAKPAAEPKIEKAQAAIKSTKRSKLDNCKKCGAHAIYCTVNGEARCRDCATKVAI